MDHYTQITPFATRPYLGGFIDGEGSIGVINGSIALRVTNTNKAVLSQLRDSFGGSIVIHTRPGRRKKACWQWVAYGQTAADALEDIFPYLREKRTQAFLAMEYRNLDPDDPLRPWILVQLSKIKHLNRAPMVPFATSNTL